MSWSADTPGALVVAATLVAATGATAQLRGPELGVAASVTFPTGDYHADAAGDGFAAGWQGMALLAFRVRRSPWGIRLDGTYGVNNANDQFKADLTTQLGQPSDAKTTLVGGNFDLTYTFYSPGPVRAYALGGLGVYRVKISITSGGVTSDTSETKLAWNFGGGLSFPLGGGAALFFEARYIDIGAVSNFPRTTFVPVTAGLRLGGR
jgi:opacity protein-like surface antigen